MTDTESGTREAFLKELNTLCHKHSLRIGVRCYGECVELTTEEVKGPGMYRTDMLPDLEWVDREEQAYWLRNSEVCLEQSRTEAKEREAAIAAGKEVPIWRNPHADITFAERDIIRSRKTLADIDAFMETVK